jgi:hypothetical protein
VQGGEIAKNARKELESKMGKSVVSQLNAHSGMMLGKGNEDSDTVEKISDRS